MQCVRFVCRWVVAFALLTSSAAYCSEIVTDHVQSMVLGRDLKFTVYLPDAYVGAKEKFPVVYLLHGYGGDERSWVQGDGARDILDDLIARHQLRPTVVVMPTVSRSSWWIDRAGELAETALMTELFPYVQGKYNVNHEQSGRAVAGVSMGGYGALSLALRHPSKFCAAGLISPAAYDPLPPETSAARKSPPFMRNGQFDPDSWKNHNYPAQLDAYARGSERVPMWIVSGDHDHLGIALASAELFWRILKIQPKQAELRIIDGDHESSTFRAALPDLLQYLARHCTGS